MATTPFADLLKCVCGEEHNRLLTDDDVFERLDQLFSNEEIGLDNTLEEIQDGDDFLIFHLTPWQWTKYVEAKTADLCLDGGNHSRKDCTTDCSERTVNCGCE